MSNDEHIPRMPRGLSAVAAATWERERIVEYLAKGRSMLWIACELRISSTTAWRRYRGLLPKKEPQRIMRRDLGKNFVPKPRRLTSEELHSRARHAAKAEKKRKKLIEQEERP